MFSKFTRQNNRLLAIILLTFVTLFSVVGTFSAHAFSLGNLEGYFDGSAVIQKGQLNTIISLNSCAALLIPQGAVDDYLVEHGLQEVEITVEMYATKLEDDSYIIDFVFGPSGSFYNPELGLILSGDYVQQNDIGLEDECGNFADAEITYNGGTIQSVIFFIEHFSEYYYPRR
jgi:hypothetical protein